MPLTIRHLRRRSTGRVFSVGARAWPATSPVPVLLAASLAAALAGVLPAAHAQSTAQFPAQRAPGGVEGGDARGTDRGPATRAAQPDPRWAPIRRVFGQEGEAEHGTLRLNFPRSDLSVRVGDHALAPGFELTSYVAFTPAGPGRVLAMSEVICREDEVGAVLDEARRQGLDVPALHNHLIGESPRILYVHVMTVGEPAAVAEKFHAVYARTATPLQHQAETKGNPADYAAVSAILGAPAEVAGGVAEYIFPRRDRLTEHGVAVPSSDALETASEVVFQPLGNGRMATGGELYVAPEEVTPVVRALGAGGIHVTAIHHHMVLETPRLYWLHWYATGEPAALARTVKTALAATRSAQQSKAD